MEENKKKDSIQIIGKREVLNKLFNTVLKNIGSDQIIKKNDGLDKMDEIIEYINNQKVDFSNLIDKRYVKGKIPKGTIEFDSVRIGFFDLYEINLFINYDNNKCGDDVWRKVFQCYSNSEWVVIHFVESRMDIESITGVSVMDNLVSKKKIIKNYTLDQIENIRKDFPEVYKSVKYLQISQQLEQEDIGLNFLLFKKNLMEENPELKIQFKEVWDELPNQIKEKEQKIKYLEQILDNLYDKEKLSYIQGFQRTEHHSEFMRG